ncbi:hypothetical protein BGX27_007198 [Mortierella sp. AM989]|nr:hypothetical protein BGX27_007198 [Mortierella sp. AM989]
MSESLMSNFIPTSGNSSDKVEDFAALQTSKLIQLLESIDYPHEISEEAIRSTLTSHYRGDNATVNTSTFLDDRSSSSSPIAEFLDWLIKNISAETNWQGYPLNQGGPLQLSDDFAYFKVGGDNNSEVKDITDQDLDREHQQLQNTLASLEKELSDLNALEAHATDANRLLDMDIHDASVHLDATASKLSETAQTVLSAYLPSSNLDMEVDADMDRMQRRGVEVEWKQDQPSSKRFIYQCQEELFQIQQLDATYLEDMEGLYRQIQDAVKLAWNDNPPNNTSSPVSTPAISHLDQLLKRNPSQEQELVRLCSTYRATKMSHIRVMAQLKCLEEELQYMKELEMKYEDNNGGLDEQDITDDHSMYTIASARSQQIQKTRQQEIELISVQRETVRLTEEMDQLLSNPASQEDGQNLSSLAASANNDGATGGVLVDICERIARSDIELRFLSAAHRDYIREQGHALKELDSIVDKLLEYYCLGVTMEQTLGVEKDIMQKQKDTLWAAVEELREYNEKSRRLHRSMDALNSDSQKTRESNDIFGRVSRNGSQDELMDAFKRNTNLAIEIQHERQILQDNLQQMFNVREMLDRQLLHRHSSTDHVQFVPKNVQISKDDLVNHTRRLQQEYAALNDQVQQLIHRKSKRA